MLDRENVSKELNGFVGRIIKRSRYNLTRSNKNVSKRLYNSLQGNSIVYPNSIQVGISMEDYGMFVDQGVKGKTSSSKAPMSPFKFGTGSGRKGGLTQGINKWVRARRFQFKDRKGKFMSYDSTAFLITRSIYNKGMSPTYFITKPFESEFNKLPDELVQAYGLDIDNFLKSIVDNG